MKSITIPRLPLTALVFLTGGALLSFVPDGALWRERVWYAGLLLTGVPVSWKTLRGMLRGEFAADVVAMLAIAGAIGLQQPLAGLVVVLMQTGGEALETYAVARASGAVEALEADAPRHAHRMTDTIVTDIDAVAIVPGDTLLVRPGELVPCDAEVLSGTSHVDTSRLTGEPVPVKALTGTKLLSGSVNQEGALTIRAVRTSQDSQYARIVELVRSAQASKSPLQRTADKIAVWFTPLTLAVCALAWFASGDVTRVLAVLVVATPCPLILAAPVAIIGGINRAARRAIIVRNGGALEALAHVQTAVFDKTGTLTIGKPRVHQIVPEGAVTADALLAMAAAVEQGSGHLLARVVVAEADSRQMRVSLADDLRETPGNGIVGRIDADTVAVGSADYLRGEMPALRARIDSMEAHADGLRAYIGSSTGALGRIEFADELRDDLHILFDDL
ncbi:MAG: HAD-IC family P-type ATPase, partial [Gemmatimonas sp.]